MIEARALPERYPCLTEQIEKHGLGGEPIQEAVAAVCRELWIAEPMPADEFYTSLDRIEAELRNAQNERMRVSEERV